MNTSAVYGPQADLHTGVHLFINPVMRESTSRSNFTEKCMYICYCNIVECYTKKKQNKSDIAILHNASFYYLHFRVKL